MDEKYFRDVTPRIVASMIALIGAYLAIKKNLDKKRKANETAKIGAQRPFSTKQREIHFDLVTTTALIANGNPDDPDHEKRGRLFWILFWGPLPMVATEGVAIFAFKRKRQRVHAARSKLGRLKIQSRFDPLRRFQWDLLPSRS
jgi:hypothetical protein